MGTGPAGGAHLPGLMQELHRLDPKWRLASREWMRSIDAPEHFDGRLTPAPGGKE